MASFEDVLKALEGAVPPQALAALENAVKAKEQEFITAAEEKFGVRPAVVSDVVHVVEDAAPAVAGAVEDAIPASAAQLVKDLTAQLAALQAQVNALKSNSSANQTTAVMGQGEPVPHTLFLDDGTVVTNHAGLATHFSVPDPNDPGNEIVKRVVSAFPSA